MALIHHPVLGVESDQPGTTLHIWRRSGWLPGPLPQEIADPPVDEHPAPEWATPRPTSEEE